MKSRGIGAAWIESFGGHASRVARTGILLLLGATAMAGPNALDIVLRDGRSRDPRRACHDITDLRIRMQDGECIVEVSMAKPFAQSMFLDATIEFDTDGNSSTGFEGFDFGVHAFVGSRFRRNVAARQRPAGDDGTKRTKDKTAQAAVDPLSRRGTVVQWTDKSSSGNDRYIHSTRERLEPPQIGERTMRFRFPLLLLRKYGLRYNKELRWRFRTESGISELPLATEYICTDAGIKIAIDGRAGEWPPIGVQVKDREGDLHPDAAEIDITNLQVEHDAKSIFALVRLARRGFGSASLEGDVLDRDTITVFLEPVGAEAYMKSREATAFTTRAELDRNGTRYSVGDRVVEFAFRRKPEQGKFRIIAYSDARRVDRVPDSGSRTLSIPTGAWTTPEKSGSTK